MKTKLLLAVLFVSVSVVAQTYTESILYSFAGGSDGSGSTTGLVVDTAGNLYGTANGGAKGIGVVFKVDSKGAETILYSFKGGTDGANPNGLTIDKSGNLFGTTAAGGLGSGTVFKITAAGKYSILHTFGRVAGDGSKPIGTLTLDTAGNIYGTTSSGGGTQSAGTVFKMTPKGVETVLYKFTISTGNVCGPAGNILRDGVGNIYGATLCGGLFGGGALFKLTPKNAESVIYNFCTDELCSDGGDPEYIVRSPQGNFYVNVQLMQEGAGGVVEVSSNGTEPSPSNGYEFCGAGFFGSPCTDGARPRGPMLLSGGDLYGTTFAGGSSATDSANGGGAVYELTEGFVETVLYSFPDPSSGTVNDGWNPFGGVIMDKAGNLYGTTSGGGANSLGTVFKLTKN
jgi:uncharacterized repeat protein (TIGR03803 family)